MLGLVVKNTGSWYCVKADDGRMVDCKVKGNFRLKGIRSTNPVAVGDRVEIRLNPALQGRYHYQVLCPNNLYRIQLSGPACRHGQLP